MEQHKKIRMPVRMLIKDPFQEGQAYVSLSLAVALLIYVGPTFLLSQSAGYLSTESRGSQAGAPQQVVSFNSFHEWHQGVQIEAAVTRQNPDVKYRGRFVNPPSAQPTRYVIVVTGAELLSGVYPDGHTYFITRTLRPLGLQCVGSMSVDDKQVDLKEALRYATDKTALVIVTGGLGPTDSDITLVRFQNRG